MDLAGKARFNTIVRVTRSQLLVSDLMMCMNLNQLED